MCSQFEGFLWLYGNEYHASFDRYSWTKKLKPLEFIHEFVLCHYHNINLDEISACYFPCVVTTLVLKHLSNLFEKLCVWD